MKFKASKAIGPARAFGVGAQSIDAVSIPCLNKSLNTTKVSNADFETFFRLPRDLRKSFLLLSLLTEVFVEPFTLLSAVRSRLIWLPLTPLRKNSSPSETKAEPISPPR